MQQKEFERRRSAQIKALKAVDEKPIMKVIDLVEMMLTENPSSPVVVREGNRQLRIVSVRADSQNNVQLHV